MSATGQPDSAPWSVGRLLSWTTDYLERHGVDDSRLASEVLLSSASRCRRIDLYARFDRVLEPEVLARFRETVRRAATHEPIAYLVEEKEFFSLPFRVSRDVLIPRAETEELVETVIDLCRVAGWPTPNLWDLGTGSGCILVALLTQLKDARGLATDQSAAALKIAMANAARHKVESRMTGLLADGLDLPESAIPEGGFHVLACNPPYIPAAHIATLDRAVRDFEPRGALTDEADGLSFYRKLAKGAARLLTHDGIIAVEVADGATQSVADIMTRNGFFALRQVRRDRTVGKERVLVFNRPS